MAIIIYIYNSDNRAIVNLSYDIYSWREKDKYDQIVRWCRENLGDIDVLSPIIMKQSECGRFAVVHRRITLKSQQDIVAFKLKFIQDDQNS